MQTVDPDEMAHIEPPHQDPLCFAVYSFYRLKTPICSNEPVQIQRRKSPPGT